MFIRISKHRSILASLLEAEVCRSRRAAHTANAEYNDLLRTSNANLTRAEGEVTNLCKDLEVSQRCSGIQAAIIRDNNSLLAEHKATITDLTNALNTRTDQLNLARSQRGCAMEERVFQQLGALLAEKPADLAEANRILEQRAERAVQTLSYGLDRSVAISILRGEI